MTKTEETPILPEKAPSNPWAVLKNPWLSFLFMLLGLYVGHTWKEFGAQLALPGELFLSLLTMSVIPIISTAIIGGLARMLRSGTAGTYMTEMIVLFVITVLIGSGVGLLAGFIGEPGTNLGPSGEVFLGKALMAETSQMENGLGEAGLWSILMQMVPQNIFGAFSAGKILSIIFASVMIGAAIGVSNSVAGARFLQIIEGIQEAFVRILGWVLYALPFGLFCMIAGQISNLGMEALVALSKFVIVFYLACLFMCLLYLLVMRIAMRRPLLDILSAMRDPLFVSFSAASCVAPIPIALKQMEDKLQQPKEVCNLVIPLSVAMNRHSYALLFSLTGVFLAQLFGKPLDLQNIVFLFFISALVGTAAAGRLAAVGVMLVYILSPIDVPVSVGVTIYITIGAILDPMVQMCILFGSCANAAVIGRLGSKKPEQKPLE